MYCRVNQIRYSSLLFRLQGQSDFPRNDPKRYEEELRAHQEASKRIKEEEARREREEEERLERRGSGRETCHSVLLEDGRTCTKRLALA